MTNLKKPTIKRRIHSLLRGQKLVDPRDLLSARRIDLAAKTIFARAYLEGNKSKWPERVYREHIRAFNNFYEEDPPKSSYEDFRDSFIKTIEGVRSSDGWKHLAPITRSKKYLMNGAHRTAASMVLNDRVNARTPKNTFIDNYNYELFTSDRPNAHAIDNDVMDYITIEYVSLKPKYIFVAIIFPAADGHRDEAHQHLRSLGEIVNMKTFRHDEFKGREIIKQLYCNSAHDEWNEGLDFVSADYKADLCFDGTGDLTVYIIEANLDETTRIKEKQYLRDLWKKDKHSIHMTDTVDEANRVVRMFFNENSRRFMKINREQEFSGQNMYSMFSQYMNLAPRSILERENIAIEGSAVFDLMNIRPGKDIDYISRNVDLNAEGSHIEKHGTEENSYHGIEVDEILTNPNYYFYYKGYKFIDINQLAVFKKNRAKNNDPKDLRDIILIDAFIKENPQYAASL